MTRIKSGIIAAVAMFVLGAGAASAASLGGQTMGVAGGDSMIVRVDESCGHLRHECREEEERGYGGHACHRFHEECGHEHCERLRHSCHEERERGEQDGACHRFHEECEER
jgi:hypothetical protein